MCDKEIKNKNITRYQKFIYSNKSRYSRFTNVDKFDLCPRCEKFLNKMMIKMKEKIKESEQMEVQLKSAREMFEELGYRLISVIWFFNLKQQDL